MALNGVERVAAQDVDGEPVQAHPTPHAHADGRDLAVRDPHPRQPLAPCADDPVPGQRGDEHFLQEPQVNVQVAPALAEVEDGIADELARAVVSRLAAAMDRLDRVRQGGGRAKLERSGVRPMV